MDSERGRRGVTGQERGDGAGTGRYDDAAVFFSVIYTENIDRDRD